MAKVDPYCGKKSNVPNAARDKEMEDLRKEVKDLKRQLLQGGNMQLQGAICSLVASTRTEGEGGATWPIEETGLVVAMVDLQ